EKTSLLPGKYFEIKDLVKVFIYKSKSRLFLITLSGIDQYRRKHTQIKNQSACFDLRKLLYERRNQLRRGTADQLPLAAGDKFLIELIDPIRTGVHPIIAPFMMDVKRNHKKADQCDGQPQQVD